MLTIHNVLYLVNLQFTLKIYLKFIKVKLFWQKSRRSVDGYCIKWLAVANFSSWYKLQKSLFFIFPHRNCAVSGYFWYNARLELKVIVVTTISCELIFLIFLSCCIFVGVKWTMFISIKLKFFFSILII